MVLNVRSCVSLSVFYVIMLSSFVLGEATAGSTTKPEQNENIWIVRTASSPEAAVDERKLPPLVTPELVVQVCK